MELGELSHRGPASSLAARLRTGDALRWLFVKLPGAAEVELAGHAGFDAVIVDTEHGATDGIELEHALRAADAAGVAALVRVSSLDPAGILAALDGGATGVVIPHVIDADQARAIVAAAHYPPAGRRGLALSTRAGRYGTASIPDHLQRAAQTTLVIVQIEDAEAVAQASAILAVAGVDGVLIGATDLSISLGHPGERDHPEVTAATDRIKEAASAAGVSVATVVRTHAEAGEWLAPAARVAVFVSAQLTADAFGAVLSPPAHGHGEPLVLLPGMLGTAEVWSEVASRLDAGRPIQHGRVRPIQHGRVGPIQHGRIDLDDTVEEMAETVLAAAPPRFALAGHSLGAIVALAIVTRAPARVTRLALLCAGARAGSPQQQSAWARMRRDVETHRFAEMIEPLAIANLAKSRRGDIDLVARQIAMGEHVGRLGCLRQLAAQSTRTDRRSDLASIGCPTLVVTGAEDEVSPVQLQVELAQGIAGAQHETLPRCGHMAPLEDPRAVAAALARWLNPALIAS